jgi:hypothetical protein
VRRRHHGPWQRWGRYGHSDPDERRPPAYRYDAWRSIVCDTLGPLDFRSDPDVPLWGEIEAGHLGPVNVGRVQTSTPHSVHRTPGLIRRGGSELYRVVLAMSGNIRLAQDDRAAQIRPGEFAIYDFARPYELAYDSAGGACWLSSCGHRRG